MLFNNGYEEAESMKHHLLKNNIPEKDILIEKDLEIRKKMHYTQQKF